MLEEESQEASCSDNSEFIAPIAGWFCN